MSAKKPVFIPGTPEQLTAQWVTSTLREANRLPAGRVQSVAVEPLNTGGVGLTGQTVRVRLQHDGADPASPTTVVAKFAAANPETRALIESYDAYAREIRFYQRYAHRMPIPTPLYYGGDYDPGSSKQPGPVRARLVDALPASSKVWISKNITKYMRPSKRRYALLIEDLGSKGEVFNIMNPPDDAQVALALDALAAMHAQFWKDSSLAGDDVFDRIVTTTPKLFTTVALKRCLPIARDRYGWLGAEEVGLLEQAAACFAEDLEAINAPVTLVHGDPRSDNLMFRPEGDVVLLDWALAANGHPGWDVGYFLSSCLSAERMANLDALVAGYEARLVELGVPVDGDDLRSVIDAAYRVAAIQQLLSLAVFDGTLDEAGDELADHWLPRLVAGMGHRWS